MDVVRDRKDGAHLQSKAISAKYTSVGVEAVRERHSGSTGPLYWISTIGAKEEHAMATGQTSRLSTKLPAIEDQSTKHLRDFSSIHIQAPLFLKIAKPGRIS